MGLIQCRRCNSYSRSGHPSFKSYVNHVPSRIGHKDNSQAPIKVVLAFALLSGVPETSALFALTFWIHLSSFTPKGIDFDGGSSQLRLKTLPSRMLAFFFSPRF